MSKKEVIAYAITHAPPGVKGGPYEGCGAIGGSTAHLGCALRWPDAGGRMWARDALASVRRSVPHARVIRIVRARPSEPSAVEVLRALVASWDETGKVREPLFANARRVLAASGPDPMPVVRAAMRRRYEREAYLDQARAGRGGTTRLWEAAENDEDAAVDADRKAGGTP